MGTLLLIAVIVLFLGLAQFYSSAFAGGPFISADNDYEDCFPDATEDYYGKHGEFDINDESRRVSEDIQGFRSINPDADLSDHYYWDDLLDAETDGYLDD